MKENNEPVGTDKRAPGGVLKHVHKVDGEDRILAVVEVSGGAYARLKAIAEALRGIDEDEIIRDSPTSVFDDFISNRLNDLMIGLDEGTANVIHAVCDESEGFRSVDIDRGEVERPVMKSLDA